MPRARNLKHDFFMDDELAEHDPIARIFFAGLWCLADYKGDLEWRPKKIKMQTIPYDDADIKEIAINLDKSGFIRFYSNGEKVYLNIRKFSTHQNPHKNEREKGSNIPEYSEKLRQVIDLNTLTINRDLSGVEPFENETNPADSLNPIPDSLNPKPNQKKVVTECDFEKFWSAYPKKMSRGQAKMSFDKLNPSRELLDQMIESIERAKSTAGWKEESGKFIPYPSTWLDAQSWLDEIDDSVDLSALSDHELTNLGRELKIHTIGKSHAELRAAIENKQESM